MLVEEDAETLEQLTAFLAWDRQPLEKTDEEVARHYEELTASIADPLVKQLVEERTNVRTIVSGLRRRRSGLPPPGAAGSLVGHIQRNWNDPEFKLKHRYPWIGELDRLLSEGHPLEAQRLLFSTSWEHWKRAVGQQYFSFEAVICYVVRWSIIDQWTSQDASLGRQRFDHLITEILSENVTSNQ